jgi:hypothetical protein
MKPVRNQLLLLMTLMLLVSNIWGQTNMSEFDSVTIHKPKVNRNLYQFFDRSAKEIQLGNENPKLIRNTANHGLRNEGNGALTALTGIGFNSADDGIWYIMGRIKCNDSLPDWNVELNCQGYQQIYRERVRNDVGSWSVQTKETNFYNWDQNATGLLMEGNDTIGSFLIRMNPRADSLLESWTAFIFPAHTADQDTSAKNKGIYKGMPAPYKDFATIGKFRGKSLIIIRNGTDLKVWIYTDNFLTCMFRPDQKDPGITKKNNLLSYMLIKENTALQERRDLFRLTMVSRFISNSLNLR